MIRTFKRYPEYKDSGVEWLGEIPANWVVKKWRYCCHVTEGQVAPDDERFRDRILIAPNHIEPGTGRILYMETAGEQGAISGKYLVRTGDIIYSKIRPALNKVCIAAGDWLCSADMYPVKVMDAGLDAKYLQYFILSEPFVRLMVDESMRVAMPKVNRETLAACPLPIPTPEEQRAVAAFLDRETARIDGLVAKKERLIELFQEQRTALITRAVTKGLDPNVPMKDSGVEWMGEIPAHWETPMFGRLIDRLEQGWSPVADDREAGPDEWAVIRLSAVHKGQFIVREHKALPADLDPDHRYEIRRGDFLLTRANTPELVGDVCVVSEERSRLMLCDLVYRIMFDLRRAVPVHMVYWFLSRSGRHQIEVEARGSSQSMVKVSQGAIRAWLVVLPPTSEQSAIATFLDRETDRIDALVARIRQAIDHLKEFRTAVITAAVTGKIDVRGEVA
jgi:type I restriction enzyme, S subunit